MWRKISLYAIPFGIAVVAACGGSSNSSNDGGGGGGGSSGSSGGGGSGDGGVICGLKMCAASEVRFALPRCRRPAWRPARARRRRSRAAPGEHVRLSPACALLLHLRRGQRDRLQDRLPGLVRFDVVPALRDQRDCGSGGIDLPFPAPTPATAQQHFDGSFCLPGWRLLLRGWRLQAPAAMPPGPRGTTFRRRSPTTPRRSTRPPR